MRLRSNAAAVVVGVGLFLAIVPAVAGPSWAIVSYELLTDGVMALLWVVSAAGIGGIVCREGRRHGGTEARRGDGGGPQPSPLPEYPSAKLTAGRARGKEGIAFSSQSFLLTFVTSAALGIGFTGLFVLAAGLLGWLNQPIAIAWEVLGLLLFSWQWWNPRQSLNTWLEKPAGINWLWLLALPPAAMVGLAATVPPGILWGDEPNGYDVVEYHLQIPRQWYEAGKITPLKENVFSYFPQGVETQYLLAMEIRGGPWEGMYFAQFMHAAMIALAAMAISAEAGTIAGVIVAVTPWCALLAPIAYVEGGVLLYGALAIIWVLRAKSLRGFFLSGLLTGFACDVKLTNIAMLLAVLPVALLLIDRTAWLKRTAIFLFGAILVLGPWLLRTAYWAGNPLFPEAMNLLGHAHFTAMQVERWRRAYVPTVGRAEALWVQLIADWRYGFILLPGALVAAVQARGSARTRFLIVLLALILATWLTFTHLQSRFLVLLIPICAMLIGSFRIRAIGISIAVLLTICCILSVGGKLVYYLSIDRHMDFGGSVGLLGRVVFTGMHGPVELPAEGRVDLVGDAAMFLYQIPSSRLGYRTVFDVVSDDPKRSAIDDWLAGSDTSQPSRLIVIDPNEIQRLARTYYGIKPLSATELKNLEGRTDVYFISPPEPNDVGDK